MTVPTGHSPHASSTDGAPARSAPVPVTVIAAGRARRTARLRVAVLGAGMIGDVHLRSARASGAEVVGVLSSTAQRSLAAAERWQVDVGYPDLDAVLSDDTIDVVHVCTPNHLHVGQAVAALRAGKHVVCEKPVATTAADARLLVDTAESAGRIVTVPFVYRYHPMVRELRARVAAGGFGAWQLLHGSYLQDWLLSPESTSWRVDPAAGGASRAFADIGSHWFDLVEWVAGVRVAELLAETTTTVADRPRVGGPTVGGPEEPAVVRARRGARQCRLRPGAPRVPVAGPSGPDRDAGARPVRQLARRRPPLGRTGGAPAGLPGVFRELRQRHLRGRPRQSP
ncbi:Gfo/Idh/MocA family protein [Streptomyces rhizosphaericus]|uniref:Gfo/Idh/MocA family protein n=1 Tax=Streptomyces rhizosphaericus TaxID=114699 RepID=UPI001FC9565C|nr:Gfo/Idh/MocA family oxidoreductase [Streptomyces rhizosphaericus]